jgi:DNA-directed RNA polymerase specialized sigma24 family protein
VRDAAAAENVVQDAMVRTLAYFASFRGDNPAYVAVNRHAILNP